MNGKTLGKICDYFTQHDYSNSLHKDIKTQKLSHLEYGSKRDNLKLSQSLEFTGDDRQLSQWGRKHDECKDGRDLGDTLRGPDLTLRSGRPPRGSGV